MYCSNCGSQNDDNSVYCNSCGSTISAGHEYAGYWRRYGAYLLDLVLIYIGFFIVLFGTLFVNLGTTASSRGTSGTSGTGLLTCLCFPAYFILVILYFAIFESSAAQGSLGKMAVGMKVVDMEGNRISFGKSLVRQLAKILSILILGIGFFICGFTEKRQGLHDIIAGTLVVMKKPVYFVEPRKGSGSRPGDDRPPAHVIN